MRISLPMMAALAAGGLLLGNRAMRRSRTDEMLDTFERDARASRDYVRHNTPGMGTIAALAGLAVGGMIVSAQMRSGRVAGVSTVEESIELDVPVSTAYNQFTQFEEFPKFMATVEEVKQLDDTHLHWRAIVAGKEKQWDAEITEQVPDKRIAWRSTGGPMNAGVVTFHKIGEDSCRVMLQMDYEPQTLGEKVVDAVGGVKLTAKGNLKRFKQLVEKRGVETGAWRGTVEQK